MARLGQRMGRAEWTKVLKADCGELQRRGEVEAARTGSERPERQRLGPDERERRLCSGRQSLLKFRELR